MLQKSKSKKINQIKYTLVIPLLAVFLMSFNTEEIYVEKVNPINDLLPSVILEPVTPTEVEIEETPITKTTLNKNLTPKITPIKVAQVDDTKHKKELEVFIITKNTSDIELDKMVAEVKRKGVTLKFKGLKRNIDGEIIAIKIEARGKDSNASYNLNSDETIAPIRLAFNKNGKNISIGNGKMKNDGITYIIKDGSSVHKARKSGSGTNAIYISGDDVNTIYEVQGSAVHIIKDEDHEHPITKQIKKVEVIKSDDKNGVVEIIVDNDVVNEEEDLTIIKSTKSGKAYKVKTIGKGNASSKVVLRTVDDTEPLYIINEKEVDSKAFKALESNDIKSMSVLKGDAAIKKYGDKGKDGVIEIITKE